MVVIDDLDKRGQVGAQGYLLLAHRFFHAARILLDASYNAVAVWMLVGTAVLALHNDSFLPGILALQDDDNLSGLQAE